MVAHECHSKNFNTKIEIEFVFILNEIEIDLNLFSY